MSTVHAALTALLACYYVFYVQDLNMFSESAAIEFTGTQPPSRQPIPGGSPGSDEVLRPHAGGGGAVTPKPQNPSGVIDFK